MSFAEVLEELPTLSIQQRQILIRRALELEDSLLSPEQEALVEARLSAHRSNPSTSLSLEAFKKKLAKDRAK